VLNKKNTWDVVSLGVGAAVLAAVFWAISAGVSPHRLWPVAGFLFVWVGTASYVVLVKRALRRRALRLRSAPVPLGVRLVKPGWLSLHEVASVVGVGAALAALAAGLGLPGIGFGIQLGLGVMSLGLLAPVFHRVRALTFEPTGLRVHDRVAEFLIPWISVLDVGLTGPAENQSVNIQIVDPGRVVASVIPDSPRYRRRIQFLFELGNPRGRALSMGDWAAGLDAPTLVRAIRERMRGQTELVN